MHLTGPDPGPGADPAQITALDSPIRRLSDHFGWCGLTRSSRHRGRWACRPPSRRFPRHGRDSARSTTPRRHGRSNSSGPTTTGTPRQLNQPGRRRGIVEAVDRGDGFLGMSAGAGPEELIATIRDAHRSGIDRTIDRSNPPRASRCCDLPAQKLCESRRVVTSNGLRQTNHRCPLNLNAGT